MKLSTCRLAVKVAKVSAVADWQDLLYYSVDYFFVVVVWVMSTGCSLVFWLRV